MPLLTRSLPSLMGTACLLLTVPAIPTVSHGCPRVRTSSSPSHGLHPFSQEAPQGWLAGHLLVSALSS